MYDKKTNTPPPSTSPAISVIIPMYNTENYIGECLDSLLGQTFQDFEVIVVDDCSTDSSCAIVESYMEQFDGRLKLYHTPKNTGSGVVARNIGLSYARGEYVYNMDNDDVLTKTALAELYTLAKKYDADVVHCERYYMSTGVGEDFIKNIHVATKKVQRPPYVEKPILESEDLAERVQRILAAKFYPTPWLKLVRRELLHEHKVLFPNISIADDIVWTYALVFFAKKILRVPNMIYIRRMREDSITGKARSPEESIRFFLNPILFGLKELDNFMSKIEFFKANPQQRYAIFENFFETRLTLLLRNTEQCTLLDVYGAIKNEFGKNLGEYDVLVSTLCTQMLKKDKILNETQQNLKQSEAFSKEGQKSIAAKDAEIKSLKDSFKLWPVYPAVSIIIPMYNAEKYIGECLDSILAQTFQNFELIIVDDCSTDSSCAIVESYMEQFDGRLKLYHTPKNTGSGALPRNKGLLLSKGEYTFIMDNDDTLTKTALEELYTLAKEYDVDIVHCEKYYFVDKDGSDIQIQQTANPSVDKPTLESQDMNKRFERLLHGDFNAVSWTKLVRRNLQIDNEIFFPYTGTWDDAVWTYALVFYAKKILRVPNTVYIYRLSEHSISRKERLPQKEVSFWLGPVLFALKSFDILLGRHEFFKTNPSSRYALLNYFLEVVFKYYAKHMENEIPEDEIYSAIKNEFGDKLGDYDVLISALCAALFSEKRKNQVPSQVTNPFKPFATARVDIVFETTFDEANFQLIFVSDNKAEISPLIPMKDGKSAFYRIHSYARKMTIIAKTNVDGKIRLRLRGQGISDPEDKTKFILYWIDYTKLVVNDKMILSTPTPAWYNEPYRYKMDVKANDEVKIYVEWLPRRSDT